MKAFVVSLMLILTAPAWAADNHEAVDSHVAASVDAHGAEASADITHFDPMTYVWELVLFFVLFAVLAFVVWPKMLAGLKGREEKQLSDLKTAENAAKEASATLAEYKQQLAEARKEAQGIIEQSRKDAQAVAAQVAADAAAKAKQTTERAAADIAAAREQAIAAIYEQAAGLSTQIAGQILKREIDPAAHQALVNESLQELSAKRN